MPTFVDFAGMNTLILSTGSFDENNIIESQVNPEFSLTNSEDELVGINLHRNGPYGYSSWKQLRASENPITRHHKANSTMTFVVQPGPMRNVLSNGELRVRDRYSALYTFTEPAIAQKAYPLVWNVGKHFKDENGNVDLENPERFSIISSYANQGIGFANDEVDKLHKFDPDEEKTEYREIYKLYAEGGLNDQASPLTYWEFLQYRETVFPHMKNQFQSENMARPNFESFYKHVRENRNSIFLSPNNFGYSPLTLTRFGQEFPQNLSHSSWPLDSESDFLTRNLSSNFNIIPKYSIVADAVPYTIIANASTGSAGILQQNYSFFLEGNYFKPGPKSYQPYELERINRALSPLPIYNRKITLFNSQSVSNPSGMPIPETASATQHSGGDIAFGELVIRDHPSLGSDHFNLPAWDTQTLTFTDFAGTELGVTASSGSGGGSYLITRNSALQYEIEFRDTQKFVLFSALQDLFDYYITGSGGDTFGLKTYSNTADSVGKYYIISTASESGRGEVESSDPTNMIQSFYVENGYENTGNYLFAGNANWDVPSTRQVKVGDTFVSSPKYPFYNSYSDYSEELRRKYKNFTVVPEFRIDSHIINLKTNSEFIPENIFELSGSEIENSSNNQFYEVYSNSDFLRQFELVNEDHADFTNGKVISLRCKAVKKFLPYEGFYPAQRTVKLAEQFYSDYNSFINTEFEDPDFDQDITNNIGSEIIMRPLFGPGVLFNSIKSGIAVDYPIISNNSSSFFGESKNNEWLYSGEFSKRIPFEALLSPQSYLGGERIRSLEPHPSGNLPISALLGQTNDNLYVDMANNFLAESIEFFLPNGNLSSISSKAEGSGFVLQSGSVYGMRISMNRSMNGKRSSVYSGSVTTKNYLPPQDIIKNGVRETFTMYSRPSAFGPPTMGVTAISGNFVLFDEDRYDYDSTIGQSTIFRRDSVNGFNFPFTPPYYHGEAWCDIILTASKDVYTVKELQEEASYSFTRYDYDHHFTNGASLATAGAIILSEGHETRGPQSLQNIDKNAVQLSSSVNIRGVGNTSDEKSRGANSLVVDTSAETNNRWVIQTKWETPMFNFNHLSSSDLNLPLYASESVPRGIWHQYGRIPEESEGVFLKTGPIPSEYQFNKMGLSEEMNDLSDVLGFSNTGIKLGRLRSSKTIYEAVVAVPFVENEGKKKFFRLDTTQVAKYKAGGEERASLTSGDPQNQIGRSVLNQMQKMEKYIFPPSFDFLNFEDVDPIAMYIFEFSHTLNQQDLADIWQNLPPDIGTTMEESEVAITHPLLKKELLGEGGGQSGNTLIDIPNKLKWMVFKVKQRAASNYFKKTVLRNPEVNTDVESGNVTQDEFGDTSKIQYNWPYDFFSLVELVKLDAEVEFGNFDESDIANYTDSIPPYEGQSADMDKIEYIVGGMEDDIIPDNQVEEEYEEEESVTLSESVFVPTEVLAGQDIGSRTAAVAGSATMRLATGIDTSAVTDETANDVVANTGGKTYAELGIPSPQEMQKTAKNIFRKKLREQLPNGKTWLDLFENNFTRGRAQRIRNRTRRRTRREIYGGGYGYTIDRYPNLDSYIGSINIADEFPNVRGS